MNDKALDVNSLAPNVVYQPALDEPCIFTLNHRHPLSRFWLAWYITNNPKVKFGDAQRKGEEIIKHLQEVEIMREVDLEAEPIKHIDTMVDGELRKLVRLEWVIWYRYAFKVGYGSATWAGQLNNPLPNSRKEEPEDDKSL